jgi:(4-O-methyl)-D-glucuronate---lignin esterase
MSIRITLVLGLLGITSLAAQEAWQAKPDVVAATTKRLPQFNFDESAVKPYQLPDVMGTGRVRSQADWKRRRGEILELYRANVYGRSPGKPQKLRFETVAETRDALDGHATLRRVAILSNQDGREHRFELALFLPNAAKDRVPVFVLINLGRAGATEMPRGVTAAASELIPRGYGLAAIQNGELAPDDKDHFREGVLQLFEGTATGDRAPDAWAALAAWGWGASRAVDYFETDPMIDMSRLAVIGHSRGGKAALWAGAQDDRFSLVISNESGEGGAALTRRNYGETLPRITTSFPHWFAPRYATFAGREAELPVDQHMLLSLMAPRALYVASADEDLWSDPRGEFLSLVHTSPVYALWKEPALSDRMPALGQPVVAGRRGYHVRTGAHALAPYDWQRYMDFADVAWRRK